MTGIILYFYINFLKKDIIRILKSSHAGILFIFSNRDVSGLMEGGSYTPETKSWSDTLPCVTDGRQDTRQASLLGGGESASYTVMSGWLFSCQGKQQGGMPFSAPVTSTDNSQGQGQVCGKVRLLCRVQGKQAFTGCADSKSGLTTHFTPPHPAGSYNRSWPLFCDIPGVAATR